MSKDEKPHCWGKMTWVLKDPVGKEKHVCSRCEHGVKACLKLTREADSKNKEQQGDLFTSLNQPSEI